MRTKTLLLTAALSAAGVASSMAQGTVFSVNAVGYVNTSLKKGFTLISNPLTAADNSIGALFGSLPDGAQVSKFNGTKFDTTTQDSLSGGFDKPAIAALLVTPGEGVFVKSAADGTITFVGEVPQGDLANSYPKGLSVRSSQVPQEGKITADLGFPAKDGDQVSKFDLATQKFATYTFDSLSGGWTSSSGALSEPTIGVGEAFFLKAAAAGTWTRKFSVNN
jgi:hypothetical protein